MERRKFAVFDIDGTLIRWQLYHAIVNQLAKQGRLSPDAYKKIHASRMIWKQRQHDESFRTYEQVVIDTYHAAITALPVEEYDKAVEAVFEEYKDQVYTYTRDLIRDLKQKGYLLLTISGSQHEIIQKLADYYGFDDAAGNIYERANGSFTGKQTRIFEDKGSVLQQMIEKHRATYDDSIAVGDSETDIDLFKQVSHPIAFNPSQGLFDKAMERGWDIVIERKNVVYKLKEQHGTYILD